MKKFRHSFLDSLISLIPILNMEIVFTTFIYISGTSNNTYRDVLLNRRIQSVRIRFSGQMQLYPIF